MSSMPDHDQPPNGDGDLAPDLESRVIVNRSEINLLRGEVRQLQEDFNIHRKTIEAWIKRDERMADESARRWDKGVDCLEQMAKSIPWGKLSIGGGLLFAFVVVAFTVTITKTSAQWGDWSIGAPSGTAENIEAARPPEE